MKKNVLLIITNLVLLITFSSCSKGSNTKPVTVAGTITASIDGVSVQYNVDALAVETTDTVTINGTKTKLYAYLVVGKSAKGEALEIAFGAPTVKAGQTFTVNDDFYGSQILYLPVYSSNTVAYSTQPVDGSTIKVSAVSSSSVQGTFSGVVYLYDGNGNITDKKTITSGLFNVPVTLKQGN